MGKQSFIEYVGNLVCVQHTSQPPSIKIIALAFKIHKRWSERGTLSYFSQKKVSSYIQTPLDISASESLCRPSLYILIKNVLINKSDIMRNILNLGGAGLILSALPTL